MITRRRVRPVLTLAIILAQAGSAAGCHVGRIECLTAGERVTLEGIVVEKEVYGPPNFGETPDVDERRRVKVLVSREPLEICAGSPEEVDIVPIHGVREVQLVDYIPAAQRGTQVSIEGTLQRAQNAYHYTPVILVIE